MRIVNIHNKKYLNNTNMKNILSLNAEEAKNFFLDEQSYRNFDLPPYFEFKGLLEDIYQQMGDDDISKFYRNGDRPKDFEDVNYKLVSNKDGRYAWRPLQLIHPVLYVDLVRLITEKDKWVTIQNRFNNLMEISKNHNIECESIPTVSMHDDEKNKSTQIKHWLREVEQKSIFYSLDFDYLFHTDITDCYGSIYTHSIAWALHNKDDAKRERRNKTLLGNLIDKQIQSNVLRSNKWDTAR